MQKLLAPIGNKRVKQESPSAVSREAILALQRSYDLDLTYTSNGIEGDTLTLRATAEVLSGSLSLGGNPPGWRLLSPPLDQRMDSHSTLFS